jgi:hypothetical protein
MRIEKPSALTLKVGSMRNSGRLHGSGPQSCESWQVSTVGLQTQRSVKCIGPLMEPTHRRTSMRTRLRLRCPPAGRHGSYAQLLENCDDSGRIIRFKDVCEHFLPSHLPVPSLHTGP